MVSWRSFKIRIYSVGIISLKKTKFSFTKCEMFPLSTHTYTHTLYFITLGSCRKNQQGADSFHRHKKVFIYPTNRFLNLFCVQLSAQNCVYVWEGQDAFRIFQLNWEEKINLKNVMEIFQLCNGHRHKQCHWYVFRSQKNGTELRLKGTRSLIAVFYQIICFSQICSVCVKKEPLSLLRWHRMLSAYRVF